MITRSWACALLMLSSTAALPAQVDTTRLRRTLDSIADRHHGTIGYTVMDLGSGARISRRGDETFPTASLGKGGVLIAVFGLVAKGQPPPDVPLTLLKIAQVPGSGQLQFIHTRITHPGPNAL